MCLTKSALSSYTWRSIKDGCRASAVHVSRVSQHARVIAQNDTSVAEVTAGCSLDAGRQDEPRILDVTWIKDRAHVSRATFHSAPILTVVLTFSISPVEPFAVINPLSAFSIVFRSSCSEVRRRWIYKRNRNICNFFRLLGYLTSGTEYKFIWTSCSLSLKVILWKSIYSSFIKAKFKSEMKINNSFTYKAWFSKEFVTSFIYNF